jgi:predicted nucleic acid-binding protein
MNGKPLRMPEAWAAYDRLFADDRVAFIDEPREIDGAFRKYARKNHSSPKLWADAWLLAFAECADGVVVTFDQGAGRPRQSYRFTDLRAMATTA